ERPLERAQGPYGRAAARRRRGDGPAELRPVSLVPPSIENAHVQPAVGAGLHAAGAAGLEKAARVVEPNIGALHEVTGEGDVVVLEEGYAGLLTRERDHAGDDVLTGLVSWVRLAREQDLDRPARVAEQLAEAGAVPKQKVRALIRREPTPEPDCQRVHVELVRGLGALLGHLEQPALEVTVDRPQVGGWNLGDRMPSSVGWIEVPPVRADVAAEQSRDFGRHPGRHMDAVGHRTDRNLRFREPAPGVF